MKKITLVKLIFSVSLLFLSVGLAGKAMAAEGECHLKHCLVPAPTVYTPVLEETTSVRPAITGLTWKTTVVKVYLDGVELKGVEQIKHEDYYGSFYVRPNFNLKPGRHVVYTVAHSEKPGWYDQSVESTYIYFNVPEVVSRPSNNTDTSADSSEEALIEVTQPEVNGQFEVKTGRIEGGVSITAEEEIKAYLATVTEESDQDISELQQTANINQLSDILENELQQEKLMEKMKRNRTIGLILLVILIVGAAVWSVVVRFDVKNRLENLKKRTDDFLPPAPGDTSTAPAETAKTSDNPPAKDYWAMPTDSPYSSYSDQKKDEQ